jgi:cell division protein FtsB
MTAFGYIYLFGQNCIKELQIQQLGVVELQKNLILLNDEIVQLKKEIYAWQTNDFYKEKVAREQLQMARKGDELFYRGT